MLPECWRLWFWQCEHFQWCKKTSVQVLYVKFYVHYWKESYFSHVFEYFNSIFLFGLSWVELGIYYWVLRFENLHQPVFNRFENFLQKKLYKFVIKFEILQFIKTWITWKILNWIEFELYLTTPIAVWWRGHWKILKSKSFAELNPPQLKSIRNSIHKTPHWEINGMHFGLERAIGDIFLSDLNHFQSKFGKFWEILFLKKWEETFHYAYTTPPSHFVVSIWY
jgi:hypothetical protein